MHLLQLRDCKGRCLHQILAACVMAACLTMQGWSALPALANEPAPNEPAETTEPTEEPKAAPESPDVPEETCEKPELRKELLDRVDRDQKARFALTDFQKANPGKQILPGDPLVEELIKIDQENTARMKEIVAEFGWPGKTLVGEKGALSAWLLVQHADLDREFQRQCLDLMQKAAPGEVSGTNIAYLTDRVLVADGKPQRYGTQLTIKEGKLVPQPLEDETRVDELRKALGMMSLAEYVAMASKLYLPEPDAEAEAESADAAEGTEATEGTAPAPEESSNGSEPNSDGPNLAKPNPDEPK